MTSPPVVPRLLVSVRNLAEARSASAGGADVIDIKEPAHGSLGRADADVIRQIVEHVHTDSSNTPISAALGEVTDVAGSCVDRLSCRLSFAKLGLAGLRCRSDWVGDWLGVRQRLQFDHNVPPAWVAVAYADAQQADAPPVGDVLQAAIETGCAGLLIDTFHKQQGRLLDIVSVSTLSDLAAATREQGLFFAVAGRLRIEDIPALRLARPDIIAVRSAACEGDDRHAQVCPEKVQTLRQSIDHTFCTSEKSPGAGVSSTADGHRSPGPLR